MPPKKPQKMNMAEFGAKFGIDAGAGLLPTHSEGKDFGKGRGKGLRDSDDSRAELNEWRSGGKGGDDRGGKGFGRRDRDAEPSRSDTGDWFAKDRPAGGGGGGGCGVGLEPRRPRTPGPLPASSPLPIKMPVLPQHVGLGLDRLEEDILKFPPGTADALYCISCIVPAARARTLIGKSGEFVKRVQDTSSAKVDIDVHDDNTRVMNCTGTLVQIYTAHAMMIQRLQEVAAQEEAAARQPQPPQSPPTQSKQELMATIANLQRQLEEAKRRGG
mmetsp:Transcript_52173/g.151888  ORF Transcript_52173/g.151888 Transcript_52173/m.151888 type:complete len:272 (+) Transcript_52173:122-937(+)